MWSAEQLGGALAELGYLGLEGGSFVGIVDRLQVHRPLHHEERQKFRRKKKWAKNGEGMYDDEET